MANLRKLKDSLVGVAKAAHSRPYTMYIVEKLRDVVKDHPNDAELGKEIRKLVNAAVKHYNL